MLHETTHTVFVISNNVLRFMILMVTCYGVLLERLANHLQ